MRLTDAAASAIHNSQRTAWRKQQAERAFLRWGLDLSQHEAERGVLDELEHRRVEAFLKEHVELIEAYATTPRSNKRRRRDYARLLLMLAFQQGLIRPEAFSKLTERGPRTRSLVRRG